MATTSETPSLVTSQDRLTGRVKWFNNQAGFGFITVTDGPRSGSDIFVHHSGVKVGSEQYKYLVQGEYVQFGLTATNGGQHEFQASDVSGINDGKLMCETRREFKQARTSYKDEEGDEEDQPVRAPRSAKPPAIERSQSSSGPLRKPRGPPRSASTQEKDAGEKKEWTLIDNKTQTKAKPGRKPRAPKDTA
jgi:cold shock CspA family protein